MEYSHYGRLRNFITKLHAGEPVTVLALGSSVTSDYGGCFHSSMQHMEQLMPHLPHTYAYRKCNKSHGWVRSFMSALNATWPHPGHALINYGLPGATSQTYSSALCLEASLPRSIDLVVMEHHSFGKAARELERLLWRLYHHFNSTLPPFILIGTMRLAPDWSIESKCLRGGGAMCRSHCPHFNTSIILEHTGQQQQQRLSDPHESDNQTDVMRMSDEEWFQAVVHNYRLTALLSTRSWFSSALRDSGLLSRLNTTTCEYLASFLIDSIHPSPQGSLLFADWLMYILYKGEQHMADTSRGARAGAHAAGGTEGHAAHGQSSASRRQVVGLGQAPLDNHEGTKSAVTSSSSGSGQGMHSSSVVTSSSGRSVHSSSSSTHDGSSTSGVSSTSSSMQQPAAGPCEGSSAPVGRSAVAGGSAGTLPAPSDLSRGISIDPTQSLEQNEVADEKLEEEEQEGQEEREEREVTGWAAPGARDLPSLIHQVLDSPHTTDCSHGMGCPHALHPSHSVLDTVHSKRVRHRRSIHSSQVSGGGGTAGAGGGTGEDAAREAAAATLGMPPLLLQPDADHVTEMRCYGVLEYIVGGIRPYQSHLLELDGFLFVEKQLKGEQPVYKPGWVAEKPGSRLKIKVNTLFPALPGTSPVKVGVVYLTSYEHMGTARVSCVAGCACEPLDLQGHSNKTRTSLLHHALLSPTQHEQCEVQVQVLDETSSGEHKFKVVQFFSKAVYKVPHAVQRNRKGQRSKQ